MWWRMCQTKSSSEELAEGTTLMASAQDPIAEGKVVYLNR